MSWQIQRRPQEQLTIRIMRLAAAKGRVRAAQFGTDVDAQFRVASPQPPPIRDSVVRRQLRSVGFPLLPVGYHDGKWRRRIDLLHAAEVIVVVVEARQGEREPPLGLDAISQLVGQQLFGTEIGPASNDKW